MGIIHIEEQLAQGVVRPLLAEHLAGDDEAQIKLVARALLHRQLGHRVQRINHRHDRIGAAVQFHGAARRGCRQHRVLCTQFQAGAHRQHIVPAGKGSGVKAAFQHILLLRDGLQRDAVQAVQDGGAISCLQYIPKLLGTSGIVGFPISQFVLGVEGRHILQGALVHLPVDLGRVQAAGRLHALLPFHLRYQRIGQGGAVRVIQVHVILTGGVGQLKVGQNQVGQVFVHVKGGVLGVKAAKQHQPQRQGADDGDGALFVAPQVCPGHRSKRSRSAMTLGFLPAAAIRVAHTQSLDGGYFSGEPCGPQAGDQHCHPGKDR